MSKRIKFFISHLSLSGLAAISIIFIIYCLWYPGEIASAEGVTHIILMLVIIDVIIGPALGFLVYKEGKKTLKIDLTIIIVLQIIALGYGVYSVAQSRPVWIVQAGSIFQVVRLNMIDEDSQMRAHTIYRQPTLLKPRWVAVDENFVNGKLFAEPTIMPETYSDISVAEARINVRAKSLKDLLEFNRLEDVERITARYPQANGWMPLRAAENAKVVLIDTHRGAVLKIVDLHPWR